MIPPIGGIKRAGTAIGNLRLNRRQGGNKAPPMAAGSDTERTISGFGSLWEDLRFDDRGGRHIEHDGRQSDMLDLCLIAVRHYAEQYPDDLRDSAVTRFHYNTKPYPAT
ncbi:hypothetical protein [Methylobacterium sp. E-045]|uniref:hypothetical protein n=1 Tax=Methylobacterium sp. E-045 TaxID=2836575 RepID=UPI001FBA07A9|nr:hypothetical protein [Methylobacterium sp. E-045]MCJ2131729.1 hypothetical protein [Methylobacterium sp. E-045]